jgi:hypothetical protein
MENNLPSLPAGVDHQAVSRLGLSELSHVLGCQNHLGKDPGVIPVNGIKRVEMFLGGDQQVNWGIGVDVFKHNQVLIFIDNIGRQPTGNDLAKDASHSFLQKE